MASPNQFSIHEIPMVLDSSFVHYFQSIQAVLATITFVII